MDYRQLRYFIAVAEELSFSRAAKRLHVSQPPLSTQIKAMEDELGTRLLARTRRAVELTQAGQLLLEHARRAVSELDLASETVRRAARGEAGVVRVGFTDSVPMLDMFAELFRSFRSSYPRVKIELRHMSTAKQLQAIADAELDVAIMRPPLDFRPAADLQVHVVWRDRLMAFLPLDHPLADIAGKLKVADLAEHEFVGMADGGCGVCDQSAMLCRRAGFAPRVVQEAHELRTVLSLVAAGIGLSILPSCYQDAGVANVVARPLDTPDAESRMLVAMRTSNASLLPRRFVECALQASSRSAPLRATDVAPVAG
ncbi:MULTISPECIES: LysR substrate-binding domain-containing protein [unclassified Bradyrhizobium]|uniref:LysR substrate-binding domain-containing protein n=1 Tax=unclassified Bradyrhizobium TaxID=2631580 RepID=UPI0024798C6B|nr:MULTISPECIES: LysR substrate-binding domain-containing protein [unclassified Bradyrhizobium]WGS19643.1 LysR substrate-binding domain-containing protein [Bradyrhizobium sp. ISRA463]WGS26485.1 LysR substrate-binding domain-containing protein [Bradyrhizobium sp. ISRA464]